MSIIVHAPGSTAIPILEEGTPDKSNSAHCGGALPSVAVASGARIRPASKITSNLGLLIFGQTSVSVFKLPQLCWLQPSPCFTRWVSDKSSARTNLSPSPNATTEGCISLASFSEAS